MRGGRKQGAADQRAGVNGSGGAESWEDRGREDEKWQDCPAFDPSLSDAPFSVSTETTWGTPGEAVCLFISAQGEGHRPPIGGCQPHSRPH